MKFYLKHSMTVLSLGLIAGGIWTQQGRTQQTTDSPRTASQSAQSEINWIKDYATGAAEAKKSGKLLFVMFRCVR